MNPQEVAIACNLDCRAGCALIAQITDGEITRVKENPIAGPYLKGCIRGFQIERTQHPEDAAVRGIEGLTL